LWLLVFFQKKESTVYPCPPVHVTQFCKPVLVVAFPAQGLLADLVVLHMEPVLYAPLLPFSQHVTILLNMFWGRGARTPCGIQVVSKSQIYTVV